MNHLPPIRAAKAPKTVRGMTLSFTAPVTIKAAAPGPDGRPPLPPTFTMDAYTGGPMNLEGWDYPVVVDLTGIEGLDQSRPTLRDHDPSLIVGHTTDTGVQDGKLKAAGVVSGHGPHVDEVVNSGTNGFPWQASIGATTLQNQFVPAGQTADANGRTFEGPINIARSTALGEISFVALGADGNTSAHIAAKAARKDTMDFNAWLAAKGFTADKLTGEQAKAMKAAYDAECKAAEAAKESAEGDPPDGDEEDDEDEEEEDDKDDKDAKAAKASRKAGKGGKGAARLSSSKSIRAAAAPADVRKQVRAAALAETQRLTAVRKAAAGHPEIEAKAIEQGWDAERTELEALRASRPSAAGPNGQFGINTGAAREVTPEIVAAAAATAGGVAEKYAFQGLSDRQKEIAASRPLRRLTIFGLCQMIAAAHGQPIHASRMDDDVIRHMFTIERSAGPNIRADAGTGYSTMSLSGVTENILNKSMLQAYGTVPSVVPDIAYQTDTNDFKQFKRYRLTAAGDFAQVGPNGELKNLSLQDESYPNQVTTRGNVVVVGRELLVNDDMGALTEIPTIIGRKAALAREKAVFTTLSTATSTVAPGASTGQAANGFNFFSTGAKNYLSGGGSALSISALTSAVQKFLEQKDANGDPIMVNPDRLLLPPALLATGKNLFNGASIVVGALGSTASKSLDPNFNTHAGNYKPLSSPWLGAASPIAGGSDTGWYLLPNPEGGFAVVQVGYLRGQRSPVIERGEANFNTLGIAMRCFYDFGVALHDYRCGTYSAGA
jgi:hypothetical protein